MGKHKENKKSKNNRFDPRSRKPKIVSSKDKKQAKGLYVIFEKLSCDIETEFLPALHTLVGLSSGSLSTVTEILNFEDDCGKGAIIKKLVARFLINDNKTAQLAAIGTLRNLSACGNEDCVDELIDCSILSPLCSLVHTYNYIPTVSELGGQPAWQDHFNILEQAAYTIYNLCEVNELAVEECTPIVKVLVQYSNLQYPGVPSTTTLAANTALLCLTENNQQACQYFKTHLSALQQYIQKTCVENSTDPLHLHNAVAITGILINLDECNTGSVSFTACMQLISCSLACPPSELLKTHVKAPQPPAPADETSPPLIDAQDNIDMADVTRINLQQEEDDQNTDQQEDKAYQDIVFDINDGKNCEVDNGSITSAGLEQMQHWMGAQQLALEILNNICTGDDDDSVVLQSKDEDNMEEDEHWQDEDQHQQVAVLQQCVVQHEMFNKILVALQPPSNSAIMQEWVTGSKFGLQLLPLVTGVRVRCLAAVQPVLELLSMDQLGGPERLFQCWTHLGRLAFAPQDNAVDAGILEGTTGAMRSVVHKFTHKEAHHLSAITLQELQSLFSYGLSCSVAGVRCNLVQMVGRLGELLIEQGTAKDLMQDPAKSVLVEATDFLIKVAGTDSYLYVAAEALDVLIDLYKEDKTNRLALECALVSRLWTVFHYFSERFKREKKDCIQRALLLTVMDNMPLFLKYKKPKVLNVNPENKHPSKDKPTKAKAKKQKKK